MKKNTLLLFLISTVYSKSKNIPPEETNLLSEYEIFPIDLPDDYCWTQIVINSETNNYEPCCKNDNTPVVYFNMDGRLGMEDGHYCGIKGYHGLWNDREKFIATKDQWEEFKIKWDSELKDDFERISVFVGEDESMVNFGWYSTTESNPIIRFSSNQDMSNAKNFIGTIEKYMVLNNKTYYSNKVTVTGLEPHSTYYYQRNLNGKWDEPISFFKTHDPNNFKFIFVGDPQIGASHDRISFAKNLQDVLTIPESTRNDAFNWNMTIYKSFEFIKEPSLLLSAGDQIDIACSPKTEEDLYLQETQYSGFLLPDLLKTIPSVIAVGNHEALTHSFKHHFNPPNPYTTPIEPELAPGYSYFFKYNNILFVILETNYGFCDDFKEVMRRAYLKYPNTDWRIAMFHHDIYSNGSNHSQEEYIVRFLRPCLTELLSKYKFDLVINGHDHAYSSSHLISFHQYLNNNNDNNNNNTNDNDNNSYNLYDIHEIKKGEINKNVNGTLYISSNSSTGSKLYGYDERDFDYISYYHQTYTSTFGVLDFKKEKDNDNVRMTITHYEVDTLRQIDEPYIFEKPVKCWSKKLGYSCCEESKEVFYEDQDGKWGYEKDNWCGIVEADIPFDTNPVVSDIIPPKNCWAYQYGFQCCFYYTKPYLVDERGSWSFERGNWCGIVTNDNDDDNPQSTTDKECWAFDLGYPCCSDPNSIIWETDSNGSWSIENNEWCGII